MLSLAFAMLFNISLYWFNSSVLVDSAFDSSAPRLKVCIACSLDKTDLIIDIMFPLKMLGKITQSLYYATQYTDNTTFY